MLKLNKLLYTLILFIPFINTIADSTINYFDRTGQGFHLGLVRGAYMLVVIAAFHFKYGILKEKSSMIILLFFAYLLILLPFSSQIMVSFSGSFIKWFGSLALFPLGVFFFRTEEKLKALSKILLWSSIPIIINFVLAQYFDIGVSAYIEDSFYYGGANIAITNTLAFIVLSTPIYFALNKPLKNHQKLFAIVVILLSVFFIIMLMKRSAILGLTLGFAVYIFISPQKGRILKFLAIGSFVVFLTLPFFAEELEKRVDARTTERNKIENEARYKEILYVLKEFNEGDIYHKLFGTEPFNSRQFFGPKYFNRDRMIHGDLTAFLYGTGIIGLLWYLLIFFSIGNRNLIFLKLFFYNKTERDLIAVVFAFLACGFFITTTGSGTMGEKGIMYLTMGAIFGFLRSRIAERSQSQT